MLRWVCPDMYLESIYKIPLDVLKRMGIRGLVVDLDNTLLVWNRSEARAELLEWLDRVRRHGFELCVVSNNAARRVELFRDALEGRQVHAIANARKPRRRAFRRAMNIMGTSPEETAVIGDQMFTDVLGGKRLGLFTVLVMPIETREFIGTRLVRRLERLVLSRLRARGLLGPPVQEN